MPKLDRSIIGKQFGRLNVLNEHRIRENSRTTQWLCLCSCGKKTWVDRPKLLSGHTESCGCEIRTLNGLSSHPLYKVWWSMKTRCYKPSYDKSYKNYGGRGIEICDEWLDFMAFYEWSTNNGYEESLTIDRIDEDGDYSPDNCQWITLSENVARSNKVTPRNLLKHMYYGISPKGRYYEFANASKFAKEHDLNGNGLRRVARGERSQYKGWEFGYTTKKNTERR